MLRITVELVKHGDERAITKLATLEISNVTPGNKVPNYRAYLVDHEHGSGRNFWVRGHPRVEGYWALIRRAIKILGYHPEARITPSKPRCS